MSRPTHFALRDTNVWDWATMCGIVWCYTGPADNAEIIYGPVRRIAGGPVLDWVGPLPHPALQRACSTRFTRQVCSWYWRADFVNELSDEAIDLHIQYG